MKIYNTLTQKIEEFVPEQAGTVKMYVCGITPYDEMHLGHGRCYVVFDVLRRYLEYKGYNVKYVQNFTDIDDKIIARAKELNISSKEVAEKYISSYYELAKIINIKSADIYPRVTDHIEDIILAIEKLIKKGYAYTTDTGVYYDISKFHDYGKLSKRNLEELISGVRIESDPTKKSPLDFALWKKVSSDEDAFWQSPWGNGRPGWHIECSVMSMKYLGVPIDIHGGGQDLIFPHHENEIAQAEGLTDRTFVRYWVHNGFVTINKEKMSKSLKNIFALKDLFTLYNPMVVRLFLISQHYRTPLDFSLDEIDQFKSVYQRFIDFNEDVKFKLQHLKPSYLNEKLKLEVDDIVSQFNSAMDSDLNFSSGLSCVHKLIKLGNEVDGKENLSYVYDKFLELLNVLGIQLPGYEPVPEEVLKLVTLREEKRKNKDFFSADELRKKVYELGYIIEDTVHGPRIKKKV